VYGDGRKRCDEAHSVNVTGILLAGFPIVVSRTWHVIGGFFSVAMVFAVCSGFGEEERCCDRVARREDAGEGGMRVRFGGRIRGPEA
jgi:hypothetical protein